jgi:hypothetical protein
MLMAARISYFIGETPTGTAVVAAAPLIWWKMDARCCAADAGCVFIREYHPASSFW